MRGMTSYARAERRGEGLYCELVVRSINSRYLEVYTRLPTEAGFLEEAFKKDIKKRITRGRIEVHVYLEIQPKQRLTLDKNLLFQYYHQMQIIARKLGSTQKIDTNNLLLLPGIIHLQERRHVDNRLIISVFKKALDHLIAFKEKEGALIKKEIVKNLKKIKTNVRYIKANTRPSLEDETSKDIAEEIALILFYVNKLEKLALSKKHGACGKTIDFFTQEILRELNAASSKSKKKNISWRLVEMKRFLERIREQAQNIE